MTKYLRKYHEYIFLISILILSVFLHFYLLPTHLHFAGDEAMMNQDIKEIFTERRLVSVGLLSSIGHNIYQSPYFYYIYVFPGMLTNFNPLTYGAFVAILSLCSVFILYYTLKGTYNKRLAMLSTFVYAISFNVNVYGRWEWTQNLIPFFLILSTFALYKYLKGNKYFLILFIFSVSSITQLHILGYFIIPALIGFMPIFIKRTKDKYVWILSAIAFILPWTPILYHEIRHNFTMTGELINFLLNPTTHSTLLQHLQTSYSYIIFFLNRTLQIDQDIVLLTIFFTGLAFLLVKAFKNKNNSIEKLISIYLLSILLLSQIIYTFYSGTIYIQYGEQLFVIYSIFAGITLYIFFMRKETYLAGIVLSIALTYNNLNSFNRDIINGKMEFYYQNKICTIVSQTPNKDVTVILNSVQNPNYLDYVCDTLYNKKLSDESNATKIEITTDWIKQFEYSIDK